MTRIDHKGYILNSCLGVSQTDRQTDINIRPDTNTQQSQFSHVVPQGNKVDGSEKRGRKDYENASNKGLNNKSRRTIDIGEHKLVNIGRLKT